MDGSLLIRIERALDAAAVALAPFTPGSVRASFKQGDDPVTQADLAIDAAVRKTLMTGDEAWLSEETADDLSRLDSEWVWIVDPLDGTREFVSGIPEWCVSIGLVRNGVPVAGGILAPSTDSRFIGAIGHGVTLNGSPVEATTRKDLEGALVLASRTEVKRGQWDPFFTTEISVRNMGSVAYKLALTAAGLADATWTLVPKNEWDVAAGAALVAAAGGKLSLPDGAERRFNQPETLMPGFIATAPHLHDPARDLIERVASH